LKGIDIHIRDGIPFWDAQIVSVALVSGITKIITEDSDFERIKDLTVINPFKK